MFKKGLPWWLKRQRSFLQHRRPGFKPWVRKIPRRRNWQPTPVLLPEKFHGRRTLIGYSLWGRKESDRTERLHFHFQFFTKHPAQWMKYHDESLERCLPRKKYSPSLKRSARLWTFQQSYRKPEDIGEYLQNSEKVLPI